MNNTPKFRYAALETIARNVLKSYDSDPQAIPVEVIMEHQYGLQFDYQYIRNNGRILGETVFDDALVPVYDSENQEYTLIPVKGGTVIIDAGLIDNKSDGRFRFTCAHELSHWLIIGSGQTAAMTAEDNSVRSSQSDITIERQADRLGGYLLMPSGTVKKAFYRMNAFSLPQQVRISKLADFFQVSRQAMEIRLNEMGLL